MDEMKDFEMQGTSEMPHVAIEEDDGEKKKGTVVLFGHELSKKKAVLAGLGGLLALALIGGGAWYAMSQQPQDAPVSASQTVKQEQQVIHIGAKADGWVKGESSSVIAHIVNKDEKVDYYHAYDANVPVALDVPAEGEYEVSLISPVNKDGSIYEVPKTSKVKSVDEDDKAGDDLPFTLKPVKAQDVKADDLNAVITQVAKAVKKGDETLSGEKGSKVVEAVKENAKANPNADADKVEEESKKAEESVSDKPTGETGAPSSKPSGGNSQGSTSTGGGNAGDANTGGNSGSNGSSGGQSQGGSNNGNSGSSSGGGNSGSNTGGGSSSGGSENKPGCDHNWVAQTKHHDAVYDTIHHDAVYTTKHHDAVYKTVAVCNGCNAQFDTASAWGSHSESQALSGNFKCGSYHSSNVVIQQAYDEQVLVKDAWDEQKLVSEAWVETIGYTCSSCGKTK